MAVAQRVIPRDTVRQIKTGSPLPSDMLNELLPITQFYTVSDTDITVNGEEKTLGFWQIDESQTRLSSDTLKISL